MCVSFINYTCPTAITQNRQSQYTCGILLLIPVCPVICDIIVIIQKIQSSLKILECLLICKLHISLRNHGNLCFCNRQTCFFQSFANCTEIIRSSKNLITVLFLAEVLITIISLYSKSRHGLHGSSNDGCYKATA